MERSRLTPPLAALRAVLRGLSGSRLSFSSCCCFLGGVPASLLDELLLELPDEELELDAARLRFVCSRATITDLVPSISFTVSSAALNGLKAGTAVVVLDLDTDSAVGEGVLCFLCERERERE